MPSIDSPSEDDLDLDELDYASNSRSEAHARSGRAEPTSISLRQVNNAPRKFWTTKKRRLARDEGEDLEALLDEGNGWNVSRRQQSRIQPSYSGSQRDSARTSTQLSELVRQELADIREEAEIEPNTESREVQVGNTTSKKKYPANVVSNAKYTPWSFLPRTLYNEFRFFLNIYFLLVALSQIIPILRIGYTSTYIVPLAFVLSITLGKEASDDISRRKRDAEANSEPYTVIAFGQDSTGSAPKEYKKKSRDLKVGDVLKLEKNHRVPADVVILKSLPSDNATGIIDSEAAAETFIRTDQLDGETDWKLRLPSTLSQELSLTEFRRLKLTAGAPDKSVNEFTGTIELQDGDGHSYDPHVARGEVALITSQGRSNGSNTREMAVPLTLDNTAWANTVLASSTTTFAVVIYTGRQTRSALSTSRSRSKTGLLELEINSLTKILCIITLSLSGILVALERFQPLNDKPWYVAIMRYLILFSTIIPISLRVNLDMAKSVYARFIQRDRGIPETIVRTSTIPEDLGRIEYLLSDKTGTLTQNEMQLRKIHVGTVSYAGEAMEEVGAYMNNTFAKAEMGHLVANPKQSNTTVRSRREIGNRVRDLVVALALCHNVTPTTDEINGEPVVSYQASSPDEIAIVEFTESVGLRLSQRDRNSITLTSTKSGQIVLKAEIKDTFPFTSESKRMGIILSIYSDIPEIRSKDDIWFFQKGADTAMSSIVLANDWLDEETSNMAREGLRTLVVGRKKLSVQQYEAFSAAYHKASLAMRDRDSGMATVIKEHLEHELELLGITGVEDRLQKDVKPSLELLRNAGVKIWMLTGDKIETARCVAVSARLVARGQHIQTITKLGTKAQAQLALDTISNRTDACMLIDGTSLAIMLSHLKDQFIEIAVELPTVVACRCSPSQKADIANLIRQHTNKRVCCIGDGGNDVSMIQAADVGIGIVGKEGRQASLAADFSVTQFCHLTKLLVWHGRNSYKRSAKLAQFIIHRGLIISVCQTMYNIAGHFDPKGLFKDWLMVGYATVYTMAPVFSLVLDTDVDEKLASLYPELYKELKSGKSLSYYTFSGWVLISVYQGIVIQGLSQLLVGQIDGNRMLSVSFTVLILNEIIMVAVAVTTWHPIMIACIVGTIGVYAASVPFLGGYYDLDYLVSWGWAWRSAAVLAISLIPVWAGKVIRRAWKPPNYRKVQGI